MRAAICQPPERSAAADGPRLGDRQASEGPAGAPGQCPCPRRRSLVRAGQAVQLPSYSGIHCGEIERDDGGEVIDGVPAGEAGLQPAHIRIGDLGVPLQSPHRNEVQV